ncbi:hypothetical protein BH10CYA1_BH10CYA1_49300 [soil metagenome]
MLPKSGLACLFLLTCLGTTLPTLSQCATDAGITRIASMEKKIFAHPYNSEILPHRVARLERFVYGSESSDPLQLRINRLISHTTASPAQKSAPMPVSSANRGYVADVSDSTFQNSQAKYPRVTDLEQQLLDRTFATDGVLTRVERLEAKVFGRVWTQQTDLALRVDRLGEYAYMNPQVEQLEQAELRRVSMLQTTVRNVVHQPQLKRVTITVVDEIESLETITFGKISASKPLGQRVDALEVTICGSAQTGKQQNLTTRVALLLSKVNSSLPNRSGV